MEPNTRLVDVLKVLCDGGVRFLIVGGLAMRFLGSSHVTDDVDVIYSRDIDNLNLLVSTLAPYHPKLAGADPNLPFHLDIKTLKNTLNLTLMTDVGRLDLLGAAAGADAFDSLWQRSIEIKAHGLLLHVVSLDDLIAMKRAANRLKDQLHLLELEAIKKINAEDTPSFGTNV